MGHIAPYNCIILPLRPRFSAHWADLTSRVRSIAALTLNGRCHWKQTLAWSAHSGRNADGAAIATYPTKRRACGRSVHVRGSSRILRWITLKK